MNFHSKVLRNWQKKVLLQTLCTFLISFSFAQEINISGKVTDGSLPLEKVSVSVSGSSQGTTTDEKGEFKITAAKGQALVFTYLGFDQKRVIVGNSTQINIVLDQSGLNALNSVVVVGYGTKRKANITGAVATVSAKELEDRPVTNVSEALQGTMSGVTVLQGNGQPGKDEGTIRIRGIGTLGNSDPMVVVDGVVSTLNDVNPNDIESVSVLKDAASA
ncbi:MAG TPA: TonB-dependent receptor plug domain-containing protein, partial [Puia sp.]|nr:TonB-dependent receptor plug domain-containing protein [Puia sp.]